MSGQDDKPRRIRKRRATATVGGTTQSGFANRSMSDLLKQGGTKPVEAPKRQDDDKTPEK